MPPLTRLIANILLACALFNMGICRAAPGVDIVKIVKIVNDSASTIHYKVIWPQEYDTRILCTNAAEGCLVAVCSARDISVLRCTASDGLKIIIPARSTMQDTRRIWGRQHGEISNTYSSIGYLGAYDQWCLTMAISHSTGPGVVSGYPLPGTHCGYLPPPNLTCTVSDNLNISYGSLVDDHVDSATASGDIDVSCSAPATVSLSLAGSRTIDLGRTPQLQASLFIKNNNLANGYSFKAGTANTRLRVTSVLDTSSTLPAGGPFQGNGILLMTYQ